MVNLTTSMPISTAVDPTSAADSDRAPWTTLFTDFSTLDYSHVVSASSFGLMFMSIGLQGTDRLIVQNAVGKTGVEYFEDLQPGGKPVRMAVERNVLYLPLPGRFRLRYDGSRLGAFQAFVTPVPHEYAPGVAAFLTQFGG